MTEPTIDELLSVIPDGSAADFDRPLPKSNMLARPEGMSRQVHRRLYRFACAYHKVEPQFARPTDRKLVRRLRNKVLRNRRDRAPRGKQNRSSKATYTKLHMLVDRV